MKADCHVQVFGGGPERLEVRMVDRSPVVRIGPEKGTSKAKFLSGKVHFGDG
jgi:hypothetical protein